MLYFKEFPDINIDQTVKECNDYIIKRYDSLNLNYSWQHIKNFDEFLIEVPSLLTLFESLNLTPAFAAFFIVLNDEPAIHIDAETNPTTCRINLPLRNCEYSETTFYTLKDNVSVTRNLGDLTIIKESDCNIVDKISLRHATALAVGHYHSVRMIENIFPRISITIGFKENASFLLFGGEPGSRTL